MARQTTRNLLKLVLGNALVLLCLIVILNLVAAALRDVEFRRDVFRDERADLPSYEDHDRAALILGEFHALETRYVPFLVWSRWPFTGETTTVNEDGDRVHTRAADPVDGVVRFFGGSAMWGSGVDDDSTIPALFNRRFPRLEVHNHGETAYHGRHEVARLVNLINQRAPMDLVVFYDGYNDVVNLCRPGVAINGSHRAAQIERRVNPDSYFVQALIGSIQEVLYGRFFSRVVFRGQDRLNRCVEDPTHARLVADTLFENWRIARMLARHAGAEFLAVLQPVAFEGAPRVDHLQLPDQERQAIALVYARLRERMTAEGSGWAHDFTDVYDGDEYVFIDAVHTSERGPRRVVDRLAPLVNAQQLHLPDQSTGTASRSQPIALSDLSS
ncbi:MAG: hypothetical protein AB7I04_24460, partial [Pseudomonadales bacterium]